MGFIRSDDFIAEDIGNWKVRAAAIDVLRASVDDASSRALQDALPSFCPFLGLLMADPNFKISHASLEMLGSLTARLGKHLRPHFRELLPGLLQALGDSKTQDSLDPTTHQQALSLVSQAVKAYGPETLDYNSIVHKLVAVLDGASPSTSGSALDVLGAVRAKGDAAFAAMLASSDSSASAERMLSARFPNEMSAATSSGHAHSSAAMRSSGPMQGSMPSDVLPDELNPFSADQSLRRSAASMGSSLSPSRGPLMNGHNGLSPPSGGHGLAGSHITSDLRHSHRGSPTASSLQIPDQHPTQPLMDVLDLPVNLEGPESPSPTGYLGASYVASQAGFQNPSSSMLRMSAQSSSGSPPLRQKGALRQSFGRNQGGMTPSGSGNSISSLNGPWPGDALRGSQEGLVREKWENAAEGPASGKTSRKVQRALFENQQPAAPALDWSIPASRLENAATSSLHWPAAPSISPAAGQHIPGSTPLYSPFAQPLQELPGAQNIEARLGELRLNSPDALGLMSQGEDGSVSPSKAGSKLAHLKRRQQEARRAMSAGGTPGFLTPVSSWSPAGSRVSSAMSELAARDSSGMYSTASGALPETLGLEGSIEQPWPSGSSSPSLSPKRSSASLPPTQRRMMRGPGPDSPMCSAASSTLVSYATMEDGSPYPSPSSPYGNGPNGFYPSQPTTPVGGSGANGHGLGASGNGSRTPSRTFRHHSSGSSLSEGGPGTPGGSGAVLETVAAEDLQPCSHPEADLEGVLQGLQRANVAKRKDLDWQAQTQDLNRARCLVKHHSRLVQPQLHALVLAAVPALEALRSTTAKSAMMLFQEIFELFGRAADGEAEHIVPSLAKKAGEVSVAGRENFLATEAEAALASMVDNLSETRVATALLASIAAKSPHVRAKLASHMDALVQGDHGLRLLGSMNVLEKLFQTAAGFLEEGSQETRTHGKRILCVVRQLTSSISYDEFRRLVARLPGDAKQRKIWEVVDSNPVPPPLPSKLGLRTPGSSRQGRLSSAGSSVSGDIAGFSGASSPLGSYPSTPLKTPPRPAARSGLSRSSLSRTPSQARSLSRGSSISGESSPSGAYYSMVPESEVSGSSLQRPSPRLTLAAMRGSSKAGGSARQLRKTGSLSSNNSLEATRQAGVPRQTSGGLSTGEVLIE
ncbi:hypothetical protein WJX84_010560, partial [Apatococcus fuscideae]